MALFAAVAIPYVYPSRSTAENRDAVGLGLLAFELRWYGRLERCSIALDGAMGVLEPADTRRRNPQRTGDLVSLPPIRASASDGGIG